MSTDTQTGQIFNALIKLCRPVERCAAPWDFLSVAPEVYTLTVEPADAVMALRQQFSELELEQAGILPAKGTQSHTLSDALGTHKMLVACRTAPDTPPFALITLRGVLPNGTCSVTAASHDYTTSADASELLLCDSVVDVVIFRSLGLTATIAIGVYPATYEWLSALADGFERAHAGQHSSSPAKWTLRLVAWKPENLDRSERLRMLATSLVLAQEHLDLQFPHVYASVLTGKEHATFDYLLSMRRASFIRQRFDKLLAQKSPITAMALQLPRPEIGFADAGRTLEDVLGEDASAPGHAERVAAAQRDYDEATYRQIVRPLLGEAGVCADHTGRALKVILSQVAQQWIRMAPRVAAAQKRRLATAKPEDTEFLPADALKQWNQTTAQYTKLLKISSDYARVLRGPVEPRRSRQY